MREPVDPKGRAVVISPQAAMQESGLDRASRIRGAQQPPGSPLPLAPKQRLLDRVRQELRLHHYSRKTEKAYVHWIRRYILFHDKRHPSEMGADEVTQFLSALATESKVSASTQNQALSALLFLYHNVLRVDLPWLDEVVRAKRPERLPVVLTDDEVARLLAQLRGVPRLMAALMYGSGLRLLECCTLSIKDLDFARHQIIVRQGKGDKDRVTLLPGALVPELCRHLEWSSASTGATWRNAPGGWSFRRPFRGSTPTPADSGPGNGYFRPPAPTSAGRPDRGAVTIFMNPCSKEKSRRQYAGLGSRNRPPVIHSGISLRRISLKTGTTSGPSKSYLGTRTFQQP